MQRSALSRDLELEGGGQRDLTRVAEPILHGRRRDGIDLRDDIVALLLEKIVYIHLEGIADRPVPEIELSSVSKVQELGMVRFAIAGDAGRITRSTRRLADDWLGAPLH